jgi:hypothetical protein
MLGRNSSEMDESYRIMVDEEAGSAIELVQLSPHGKVAAEDNSPPRNAMDEPVVLAAPIVAAPVQRPPFYEMHIYTPSDGRIRHLLTQAQVEAEFRPQEIAAAQGIQAEATCDSQRMKNAATGTGVGFGIGWIATLTCGLSSTATLGFAGFGCLLFTCFNPPRLCEDFPEEVVALRRN